MSKHYDIFIKFSDSEEYVNKINWRVLLEIYKNAPTLYDKIFHIEIYMRECDCDFIKRERDYDSREDCDEDCYFNEDETDLKLDEINRLPSSLKYLDLSGYEGDIFIKGKNMILPDTVKYLDITQCDLGTFPFENIPANLCEFHIQGNGFKELGDLPKTLTKFNCSYNFGLKIPDVSHTALTEFQFINCEIKELPVLPDTIEILHIEVNRIKYIEKLPKNLRILKCGMNPIYELPELPEKIEHLECYECKRLCVLPELEHLHNLKKIEIRGTSLLRLPNLPKDIKTLYIPQNKLIHLPDLPILVREYGSRYDFTNNNIKKLTKGMILYLRNVVGPIKTNSHYSRIRLLAPNYESNRRALCGGYSIHESTIKSGDGRFEKFWLMFEWNPIVYTMMQYRDDLNEFFNKEFIDIDKMQKYYMEHPTDFTEKYNAVKKIENWFLECKYNPKYGYCQQRLLNEFNESYGKPS